MDCRSKRLKVDAEGVTDDGRPLAVEALSVVLVRLRRILTCFGSNATMEGKEESAD